MRHLLFVRKAILNLGLLAAVCAGACGAASAADASAGAVRSIEHVAGDVYRFQGDESHFGVFMVTPRGVILVDPISLEAANWVKAEIASRFNNAKVVQVVYSHHHWDHASGAAAFPHAKIISRVETGPDLRIMAEDPKQRADFRDVVMPTEFYNSPVHRITLGGKTLELHYVPSSHADDISYVYFPAEKILFGVDVISIKRLLYINMPRFDEPDQMATLNQAMAFDADIIVPGHGSIGSKHDLQDFRQYVLDLHREVQAGIDQGETLPRMQADLRLEKYAQWINYTEWRTLNIEGMYTYLMKK